MLRVAAMSLIRSQTALTATARKLAILVYRTLTGTLGYQDPGAHTYPRANARGSCADSSNVRTPWGLRS